MDTLYKSPLQATALATNTDYWNDSCGIAELSYAIDHGAVGATSNPTIVLDILRQEMHLWEARMYEIIAENPEWSEEQVAWQIFEEVALKGAELLLPVFEREGHKKGRLSIQTNPVNYRNARALTEQAVYFNSLAPNMQVKIPVTKAGVRAIEEATYRGVSVNATVCFTVAQTLAVADAVERGLDRRTAEGLPIDEMSPVCTIMVGRVDDWLQVLVKRDGVLVEPGFVSWAGIACMKRAYKIYQERGYRTRLLAAAYRHHLHWTEFVGGDIVLTIPYGWQKKFNASDIPVQERMDIPVDEQIVETLYRSFPDFRRAYDPDGLTPEEFDTYGATVRTLRSFIASYRELQALVRDFMLPNPDTKR